LSLAQPFFFTVFIVLPNLPNPCMILLLKQHMRKTNKKLLTCMNPSFSIHF